MRKHLQFVCVFTLLARPLWVAAQQVDHSQHQHELASPTKPSTDSSSEVNHVAPEPPAHIMDDMSYREMVDVMQMDDKALVGTVVFDELEWRNSDDGDAAGWDARAWYGGDYNKVLVKTEGELIDGAEDARAELLWDRIFARWWSVQVGARTDFGKGPSRTWAAIGIEGLAPYWFDVDASLYVGDGGRIAGRITIVYELLITQRLMLRPKFEANLYGQDDRERGLGSGLSDIDLGLRLRYEIRREFAPYVGVAWHRRYGGTADYAEAAGKEVNEMQWLAGLRIWF